MSRPLPTTATRDDRVADLTAVARRTNLPCWRIRDVSDEPAAIEWREDGVRYRLTPTGDADERAEWRWEVLTPGLWDDGEVVGLDAAIRAARLSAGAWLVADGAA